MRTCFLIEGWNEIIVPLIFLRRANKASPQFLLRTFVQDESCYVVKRRAAG